MSEARFARPRQAWTMFGTKKTKFFEDVKEGLLPRPVKLGERAVGLPMEEIEEIIAFRKSHPDATSADIKALVASIHERRMTQEAA